MMAETGTSFTRLQKIIIAAVLFLASLILPIETAGAKEIGEGNAYTHNTLRAMARVYMASSSYDKAQPLLENALNAARKSKASDSDICACALDLAYLYKNQGKLNEAETICLQGLELQRKVYGPKHPYVTYTLRILGEIYRGQGRYPEATDCLERAMAIMCGVSGEDDPDMAPINVDMARLLAAKGDFAQAESCFNKAIPVIERSYGPAHLYTSRVLTSLAALHVLQGRYAEAEALIRRALPVQEKAYAANPHLIVPAWMVMSQVYMAKGDLTGAKMLLAKCLSAAEEKPVAGHLMDVLETLVRFHNETGNVKEAARLQQRVKKLQASKGFAYIPTASTVQ